MTPSTRSFSAFVFSILLSTTTSKFIASAFAPTPLSSRTIVTPINTNFLPSFSSTSSFPLYATSTIPPKNPKSNSSSSDITPSTKFGSPLSDSIKEANRFAIGFLKGSIFDTFFAGSDYQRAFARFYALETIARVPYFSYLSVLHLYETLGKWRRAKYLKLHFAESWNELHHLLIMEELGGNDKFFDRFIAQHIAVGYYFVVIFLYLLNPVEAYNLNQEVEEHAYATYDQFLKENEEELKEMKPPRVAIEYYLEGDMYMFDEFQTECELRRPVIDNLYDVFVAIREDEAAHVKTMEKLQTELDVSSMNEDGECEVDVF
mmetsp:Transcript_15680/g.32977  ORF Transcript_15680/g.32977 Transcript_15680/m.32977 type:complete len:318 (+) Transcript_15680:143-1096(+)|eukprot:CAMPEP_0171329100 /NCGR_PEP_ID=MMETSP0878-20121228/1030_1 /TAXON_ID=67004 /ORGANISM="Thalassiosira weissflogii, Strain CCMP1336" /LENGTH=317 /DNA_ID=CAMNT_0011829003 /DNA_START=96 /DNA_END=1049 /DNA_ORIENTATION=+